MAPADAAPGPHPDRIATTLADRERRLVSADGNSSTRATANSHADARVDLQLLWFAADRALAERGTDAARAHLAGLDTADLRDGTIRDGTARGLLARLEEAISLCPDTTETRHADDVGDDEAELEKVLKGKVFTGKELRRKREILVASAQTRIRFSRREGILVVDRERGVHAENCIQFEDRADLGCLDAFRGDPQERARLFSPGFLKPTELTQSRDEDRLVLEGRLGRGASGFPCRITLLGRKDESGIRMTVRIDNRLRDHRLRIRFAGITDQDFISLAGTPSFDAIHHRGRSFLAATLVRACGRLRVGEEYVATPAAQQLQVVEHEFGLGIAI